MSCRLVWRRSWYHQNGVVVVVCSVLQWSKMQWMLWIGWLHFTHWTKPKAWALYRTGMYADMLMTFALRHPMSNGLSKPSFTVCCRLQMMMVVVVVAVVVAMMVMVTLSLLVLNPLADCCRCKRLCLLLLVHANTSTTCYQSPKCQSRSQIWSRNQSL